MLLGLSQRIDGHRTCEAKNLSQQAIGMEIDVHDGLVL